MSEIGIVAAAAIVYALLSRPLDRAGVTAPLFLVAVGASLALLTSDVLDAGTLGIEAAGTVALVLELTLAIVLFTDALEVGSLSRLAGVSAVRLLLIGMPLTIAAGTLAAAGLVPGLGIWEAAILATVLAPTDAALGQAFVSDERVPGTVRRALTVESGLNDGLALPFLAVFVALAAEAQGIEVEDIAPLRFALEQVGFGGLVALVLGGPLALAVARAGERGLIEAGYARLAVLGIPVLLWVVADAIGGNGFIAAFCGGLVAGRLAGAALRRSAAFALGEGQLLGVIVWLAFGVLAVGVLEREGAPFSAGLIVFCVLSLTLLRGLPVLAAIAGEPFARPERLAIAWFGPRGLASIVYVLFVVEEVPDLAGLREITLAMVLTVLASVTLHGLSARPLAARLAEGARGRPAGRA